MMGNKNDLRILFEQGKYSELLEKSFDHPAYSGPRTEQTLVLGALVFSGRDVDARLFFDRHEANLTPDQLEEARFYRTIQFVRSGEILLAEAQVAQQSEPGFFGHQARAFLGYYLGQRAQAKAAAKQALESAIEIRSLWARLLALDLLSHLNFQDGSIQPALKGLEQCREMALRIGNANIAEAVAINMALYQAQVRVPSTRGLGQLEQVLDKTRVEDTYSRANILIELGRQATLLGQWQRAERFLSRALTFVYQFANAKQEVLLNLRWSHLAYCQCEFEKALNFIAVSKSKANTVGEEALTLSIHGLEMDILERMPFDEAFIEQKRQAFIDLQMKLESHVNTRILHRRGANSKSVRFGVDPFADWLDELEKQDDPRNYIIAAGAFGFLKSRGHLPAQALSGLVDLDSRQVIFADPVSVEVINFSTRKRLFEILVALLDGFRERGELFEAIWRTKYVPHLHDSIVYTTLAQLRKHLDRFSIFLVTGEKGYSLDARVSIRVLGREQRRPPRPLAALVIPRQLELNERQSKLLKMMSPTDLIDTRTYAKHFDVSTATANRDLRELARLKHLKRRGRSRDIAYALQTKNDRIYHPV